MMIIIWLQIMFDDYENDVSSLYMILNDWLEHSFGGKHVLHMAGSTD